MTSSQTETVVVSDTTTSLKPPPLWNVVFFNDKKTHYEFVILVLMHLFNKDYDSATEITNYIHENGRAVVATYTHEIAASKRDETVSTARANGHPLRVEIEPADSDNSGDSQ